MMWLGGGRVVARMRKLSLVEQGICKLVVLKQYSLFCKKLNEEEKLRILFYYQSLLA